MDYWPTTRTCDPDTPKTWPDFLGQTYGPGDIVAVAVINGRSPQMVFARVVQINRLNSRGEEHIEQRSWWDGGPHFHSPALCCPECLCGSFTDAHPDSDWARQEAAERAEAIGELLDLDHEFTAPRPVLPGRGRQP